MDCQGNGRNDLPYRPRPDLTRRWAHGHESRLSEAVGLVDRKSAERSELALELRSDDLLLAGSSLSHLGAFYVTFAALSVGAGTIVARTFDGDELLPLLREDRPTVLSMLPSALFALTRDHDAAHEDFASLPTLSCRGRQRLR